MPTREQSALRAGPWRPCALKMSSTDVESVFCDVGTLVQICFFEVRKCFVVKAQFLPRSVGEKTGISAVFPLACGISGVLVVGATYVRSTKSYSTHCQEKRQKNQKYLPKNQIMPFRVILSSHHDSISTPS